MIYLWYQINHLTTKAVQKFLTDPVYLGLKISQVQILLCLGYQCGGIKIRNKIY